MSNKGGLGVFRIAVAGCLIALPIKAAPQDRVIYGEDNRLDLFDSGNTPMQLELARSTAIIVRNSNLTRVGASDKFSLPGDTFGASQHLCASEPFFDQPTPGFCSGFLVGEDLFVTAGHCIVDETACKATALVFGYGYDHQGKDLSTVSADDVFHCQSIVGRVQNPGRSDDFAVIKLDRAVVGREPLKIRRTGQIKVGDGVTVIGHPMGLPTKIASGANVRSAAADLPYFVANLDTYGGNSGSAVFNTTTGEVEGILVRGETDLVSNGACNVSKKCADGSCRGEDVTKASIFVQYIPAAP
jgi:S1-C subfamily serine protease